MLISCLQCNQKGAQYGGLCMNLKRTLFSLLVLTLKAVKCWMRWWFNGCSLRVFFFFFSLSWKTKYLCYFFTEFSAFPDGVISWQLRTFYILYYEGLPEHSIGNLDSSIIPTEHESKSIVRQVLFQNIDWLCMFKLFQTPWKRNYSLFKYRAATTCT